MNPFSKNKPTPPTPPTKLDPVAVETDYLRSNTLPPSQMMWCANCGGRVLWVKSYSDYNVGTGKKGSHYNWKCENAADYSYSRSYSPHYGEASIMMFDRTISRWYESKQQFLDPWILERQFMNPSVPGSNETRTGSM